MRISGRAAASGSTSVAVAMNTGTLQRRSLLYVDLTKGSPNYTVKPFYGSGTQALLDFTPAQFLDGLEQAGTPNVAGQAFTAGTAFTPACDESAGTLDTVSVFWNKAAFPLELYMLAVYRAA